RCRMPPSARSLAQAARLSTRNPATAKLEADVSVWGKKMANAGWMMLLLVAAGLEAGGDAPVRHGPHGAGLGMRVGCLAAGGIGLFAYGVTVNLPPWDFGRLLGVYVALFFLVAQLINWLAFGVTPGPRILVGGVLIIGGAMVITFWESR